MRQVQRKNLKRRAGTLALEGVFLRKWPRSVHRVPDPRTEDIIATIRVGDHEFSPIDPLVRRNPRIEGVGDCGTG